VNDVEARGTAGSGHEAQCSQCHRTDGSTLGRFATVSALGWVQTIACPSCATALRAEGHVLTYVGRVASDPEPAVARACDRCRAVRDDVERVLISGLAGSQERWWCGPCVDGHRASELLQVVEVVGDG
jgi:hypothetical protein